MRPQKKPANGINEIFYTAVLWLLLPYIFMRLLWRARKQPEYLRHIGERFGFYAVRSMLQWTPPSRQ